MRLVSILTLAILINIPGCKTKEECKTCSGTGNVNCSICNGDKIAEQNEDCNICEKGHIICHECEGEGSGQCNSCDGAGMVMSVCTACGGNGLQGGYYGTCGVCGGSAMTMKPCGNCSGTGHYECEECNSQGYFSCEECVGKGFIVSEFSCNKCNNGKEMCSTCKGEGFIIK